MKQHQILSMTLAALASLALLAPLAAGRQDRRQEILLQKAIQKETVDGDLNAAIEMYRQIAASPGENRAVVAKALLQIGKCYEKLGSQQARKAYETLLSQYSDQREIATEARTRLAALAKPTDDSGITMRQVWSGSDANSAGTPSPDGRFLLYVDWDSGGNVAIRELATGENRLVTTSASPGHFALNPRMSPDGKWIAYQWQNERFTYDLRLIGIDGGSPRVLYADDDYEVYPASWSPDGKQIAVRRYILQVSAKGGPIRTEIAVVDVAGGYIRVLKSLERPCMTKISYSSDGRYLAYDFPSDSDSGRYDISLLASDGSREGPLVRHPANDRLLGWMPGTRTLLFRSDRSDTHDLYMLKVSGDGAPGEPVAVKRAIGEIDSLGFVHDGSFYYSVYTRSSSLSVAPFDLKTGRIQLEAARAYRGSNMQPRWSRDGNSLAFVTETNEPAGPGFPVRGLRIQNMVTGEIREIADHLDVESFCWFPDGRAILVQGKDSEENGKYGIHKVELPSGNTLLFWELPDGPHPGTLWTDGRMVIYPKRDILAIRELDTGHEKDLFHFSGSEERLRIRVSPDGKYLLILGRKRLQLLPVAGGVVRDLVTLGDPQFIPRLIGWTPDNKFLFFIVADGHGSHSCNRISMDGGSPEKLWDSRDPIIGRFAIHPDGKQIAIFGIKQTTEIWVMKNLLQFVK